MNNIYTFEEFLENLNPKFDGSFIYEYNEWNISYSDRKGHYITDRLMERNKSISTDPVNEINKLVCKFINWINKNNAIDYFSYGVKFKKKKYIVILDGSSKDKILNIRTIRSLDMGVNLKTKILNI